MLHIGLIGTGFGAKVHAPGWKRVPGAALVGIAGKNERDARVAADQEGIRAYPTWQALVADPAIDTVDIAVPPHLHGEIIAAAANAGKSILCEKPFCASLEEARTALALVKKNNVRHAIDFEFIFIPHFAYFKELLSAHIIGDIRSVRVEWITGGQASPDAPLRWVNELSKSGGALGNYGSHVFHYLEWLFQPIQSVSGLLSLTRPVPGADAEDTCHVIALMERGIPVSIVISTTVYEGCGHVITVSGSKGRLTLTNPDVRDPVKHFTIFHATPDHPSLELPLPSHFQPIDAAMTDSRLDPFIRLAAAFANPREANVAPSFYDGVRSQTIIEAVRKSHETKAWISLI